MMGLLTWCGLMSPVSRWRPTVGSAVERLEPNLVRSAGNITMIFLVHTEINLTTPEINSTVYPYPCRPKHVTKVHVLGGISWFGPTPLVIFDGIMDDD